MSSTKRYKQPSENNHRFQDIPPRFKRQKSFTSQKLQSAMESTDQNSHPSQKGKKSWGDSFPSTGSSAMQKGSQFPREGRKITKKLATQKAQQNAEKNLLKPQTQPFVLSPMENRLFSLVRNDEYENPQFSATQIPSCSSSSIPHLQPVIPPFSSPAHNSNIHPHATVRNQPDPYKWVENNQTANGFHSPEQRSSPSPSVSSTRSMNNQSPNASYSDPDIRTIEMLRELERVADQTDVGNEESSNDKNSLVSHHLRMLMCAVDRYTQGVDEDMSSDSGDDEEVPPQNSTLTPTSFQKSPSVFSSVTPCHIPSPPQTHVGDISQNQEFSDTDSAFSDEYYYSPIKHVDQFSPIKQIDLFSSATVNPRMLNSWNLWATPSFNALDVYNVTSPNANHNNFHYPPHPSTFMFDYNNMYHGRDTF